MRVTILPMTIYILTKACRAAVSIMVYCGLSTATEEGFFSVKF